MSVLIWALAIAITAAAATVQGTVGVGFAMLSVPLLSLLHPELAPAPQLLVALPLTIGMAFRERRAIDLRGIGWILVGRLPGAFLGVFLLGVATARVLDAFIGIVVLGAVIIIGTGFHLKRTRMTKTLAGVASGTTGVVSSIGGPPIALIYSSEESDTIRSTLAVIFTFGVTTSAFFRWLSGNFTMRDVEVAAVLLPAVLAGLYISVRIKDKVSRERVRAAIIIVCGIAAAALLLRAVAG